MSDPNQNNLDNHDTESTKETTFNLDENIYIEPQKEFLFNHKYVRYFIIISFLLWVTFFAIVYYKYNKQLSFLENILLIFSLYKYKNAFDKFNKQQNNNTSSNSS